MDVKSSQFVPLASIALADADLQAAVTRGTTNAVTRREAAMYAFGHDHGEALRAQAAAAKRRALRDLPDLLEQAEARMTANGITVLWAQDGAEAVQHVLDVAARHNVQRAVKAKSMVSEELGLNHVLEAHGITVTETDLGEWIVQLDNDAPSHLIAPIIHKTKDSIRDVLMREVAMPATDRAEDMAHFARAWLRPKYLEADMGLSGGNFIIAETGSLALVTNEGNGRLCTSMPRVHVALVGIEKVVATLEDYLTLTQVLVRSGTGQAMSVYTNILNGPRRADEPDGPDHVYVVLVDNGRSRIYVSEYAEALACIRCGACLNACPVYQSTGGHAYGWVYAGPIGAVVTPLLKGLEDTAPLPHASSLCGRCKQVCPVDIDIPRMLIALRRDEVVQGITEPAMDASLRAWSVGFSNPVFYSAGSLAARFATRALGLNKVVPGWTTNRDFPPFAARPFRQLWAERQKARAHATTPNEVHVTYSANAHNAHDASSANGGHTA